MNRKFHILTRLNGATDKSYANGKASAPPAPDYASAAKETAAGNLETAKYTTQANRVNQVTPYGNLTYSMTPTIDQGAYDTAMNQYQTELANYNQALNKYNSQSNNLSNIGMGNLNSSRAKAPVAPVAPTSDKYQTGQNWTATQTFSPEQQAIYDQQSKLNQGLMETANTGLNYANDVLSKPGVDTSKLPSYGINPGETYSDAIMRRLAPQISQENEMSDAQLANQGIAQGTEAYQNAKRQLAMNQNDRQLGAITSGMNVGLGANQQAFQQEAYNQMQPINVINALRTGSQVQNPTYAQNAQMPQVAGADILGATQQGYNAQLANVNAQNAASGNFMGGLMNLGGAYLMSDENLKTDIKRIGTHDLGIGIYSYNYKDGYDLPKGIQVGVMAQEVEKVMPDAVIVTDNGFKAVNYEMLGA